MPKRFLRDADLFIGVALAGGVAVLSVAGKANSALVFAVVLALLALQLTLFLRLRPLVTELRRSSQKQDATLRKLERVLKGRFPASSAFRFEYPDFKRDLKRADRVLVIAAGSLHTTVRRFRQEFVSALQRGAEIRLLCPDPADARAMELLAANEGTSPEVMSHTVEANLRIATRLRSAASRPGSLTIKTTPNLPRLGMVHIAKRGDALDAESLLVKLLPYGPDVGTAPVFRLE